MHLDRSTELKMKAFPVCCSHSQRLKPLSNSAKHIAIYDVSCCGFAYLTLWSNFMSN